MWIAEVAENTFSAASITITRCRWLVGRSWIALAKWYAVQSPMIPAPTNGSSGGAIRLELIV